MKNHQLNPYLYMGPATKYTDEGLAPVIVLMGLPGAGKSSLIGAINAMWEASLPVMRREPYAEAQDSGENAAQLVANAVFRPYEVVVCSADHYFLDSDGRYVFDVNRIGYAHYACLARARAVIEADVDGDHPIFIDNTNLTWAERSRYYALAELAGRPVYTVHVKADPETAPEVLALRNTHGVTVGAIRAMTARVESNPPFVRAAIEVVGSMSSDQVRELVQSLKACRERICASVL